MDTEKSSPLYIILVIQTSSYQLATKDCTLIEMYIYFMWPLLMYILYMYKWKENFKILS